MKTTKEILIEARAKIAQPECWTQGVLAKDEAGNRVEADDANAVCWCAMGAVAACSRVRLWPAFDALDACADGNLVAFNDTHTHAEVLAMFDKAIEAQEEYKRELDAFNTGLMWDEGESDEWKRGYADAAQAYPEIGT